MVYIGNNKKPDAGAGKKSQIVEGQWEEVRSKLELDVRYEI
jgi:hypothetical protein